MALEVKPQDKLYVLVRKDISPGYQIVQSCHAVEELAARHVTEVRDHVRHRGNTMIVLQVSDELSLLRFERLLGSIPNLPVALFWEPDINEYTALAVVPGVLAGVDYTHLFEGLPLAGSHLTKKSRWKRFLSR